MRYRLTLIGILASLILACVAGASEQTPAGKSVPLDLRQPLKNASLRVESIAFAKPQEVTINGVKRTVQKAIEFTVTSSEPILARALDPEIIVNNLRVRDYRYQDARTLVFTLYEPDKVRDGAEVRLQYGTDEATRTPLGRLKLVEVKKVTR